MAMFFALLTMAGWATGDLYAAIASRKFGSRTAYFWGMTFSLILASLYIPFAGGISNFGMFTFAFVINIVHVIANLAYLRGLEVGNAAIVGTLSGTFTMLTVVISIFLFGEFLSAFQTLGVIFILLGGIMVSLKHDGKNTFRRKNIFSDPGIIFALVAVAGWGIYFALVRIPAESIGWFWSGYPMYVLTLFLPVFYKDLRKKAFSIFSKGKGLIVFSGFVLLLIADFAYNMGILQGFTSIVAPVAGAYPVLFVVLARYAFHEHLTRQQKSGIGITLVGIVLMGLNPA